MVATVVHAATVTTSTAAAVMEQPDHQPQGAPELSSAKAFLLARPFGVYTCARAVPSGDAQQQLRLVLWPFHLARLRRGLLSELSLDGSDDGDSIFAALELVTTQLVTQALRAAGDGTANHAMVTALWFQQDGSIQIHVHICTMPQVKANTSTVLVHGDARRNAECKHSRWIVDRIPLERHQAEVAATLALDIHESVLSSVNAAGERVLLEGLITNLFVVKDGCVYTADEGILSGSTREMVLRACESLGIVVVLEPPSLAEISSWEAAFVTSAVRIVVPVATVLWHTAGDPRGSVVSHTLDAKASELQLLQPLRAQICDLWQPLSN